MAKKVFVTGDPGVGKTTLIGRVVYELKLKGLRVGGVLTRDVRVKGVRTGFQIVSLVDGTIGTLASTSLKTGPKVGKYVVNLVDLKEVFASSILYSMDHSDIIVCDEVGPMELLSPDVRRAIEALLDCDKPVIGSIHKRLRDPIIERLKSLPEVEVFEVTFENRQQLHQAVLESLLCNVGQG
ncbi:MAG: NTPase [Nitrososphaeria archaeon]